MSASLDLFILPVARQNGQDQPDLSGVYPVPTIKHPARGREADRVLLYLTLVGSLPLAQDQFQHLLDGLGECYFKSSGTATAAMRAVADLLNDYLLERNLRSSNSGRQALGWLTQIVLRSDMVYLAHSGSVHTYILSPENPLHFYDPASSGRGLGSSRQAAMRYFHTTLQPGQYMIAAHQPSSAWESQLLRTGHNLDFDGLRRQMSQAAEQELSALLIQAQTGTGKLNLMRVKQPAVDMARPAPAAPPPPRGASPVPQPPAVDLPKPQAPVAVETPAPSPAAFSSAQVTTASPPAPVVRPPFLKPASVETTPSTAAAADTPQAVPTRQQSAVAQETRPPVEKPSTNKMPATKASSPSPAVQKLQAIGASFYLAVRTFWRAVRTSFEHLGQSLLTLFKRVMPDETTFDVSPSTLLFLALIIPLIIGVAGAMVYIERGQQMQYDNFYNQAAQMALKAQAQSTPADQRSNWNEVLNLVDKAETYQVTPESQKLRLQARGVVDSLDGITRLDFHSAILGGLNADLKITRMAATEGDLYLLDGTQGRVLRAVFTGGGYQLDPSFSCGPGPGKIYVSTIVDIDALPRINERGATLLAMDSNGVMLQCVPGGEPFIQQLTPASTNFGTPRAFDLNDGDVYVLDPSSNAVWIYRNMDFAQPPRFYFGDQIPPMQDVIDLTVNLDHLYLLHSDGHQTRCTYSGLTDVPTRCEDPYLYADRRPGHSDGAVLDAIFDQVFLAPPPEPSLYLLDPAGQAVYRVGLQLSFDTQYRASAPLPKVKATAFTISPNRLIFMALDNQVYFATLP